MLFGVLELYFLKSIGLDPAAVSRLRRKLGRARGIARREAAGAAAAAAAAMLAILTTVTVTTACSPSLGGMSVSPAFIPAPVCDIAGCTPTALTITLPSAPACPVVLALSVEYGVIYDVPDLYSWHCTGIDAYIIHDPGSGWPVSCCIPIGEPPTAQYHCPAPPYEPGKDDIFKALVSPRSANLVGNLLYNRTATGWSIVSEVEFANVPPPSRILARVLAGVGIFGAVLALFASVMRRMHSAVESAPGWCIVVHLAASTVLLATQPALANHLRQHGDPHSTKQRLVAAGLLYAGVSLAYSIMLIYIPQFKNVVTEDSGGFHVEGIGRVGFSKHALQHFLSQFITPRPRDRPNP